MTWCLIGNHTLFKLVMTKLIVQICVFMLWKLNYTNVFSVAFYSLQPVTHNSAQLNSIHIDCLKSALFIELQLSNQGAHLGFNESTILLLQPGLIGIKTIDKESIQTTIRFMFCTSYGTFTTLWLRQMATIFQTTFSNAFSWMKMFKFRLRCLFPRVQLTILQHWFR